LGLTVTGSSAGMPRDPSRHLPASARPLVAKGGWSADVLPTAAAAGGVATGEPDSRKSGASLGAAAVA
jgi:hypothetical protein